MDKAHFTILLGGDVTVTDRLRDAVAGSRVIAADGGMRHARPLGLTPELWVGDFDSASKELLDAWPGVTRQPYPAAKAVTDGEIAVSEALARGAGTLLLVGALGGARSDHALQHFLYAVALAERGLDVSLTSGEEEARPLLPGSLDVDLPAGSLFRWPASQPWRGWISAMCVTRWRISRLLSVPPALFPMSRMAALCIFRLKAEKPSCSPALMI